MKRIKAALLALMMLALALLCGCSLALPEEELSGDTFAGLWAVYEPWGREDERVFSFEGEGDNCLIAYQEYSPDENARMMQAGGAFSEVHQSINFTDEGADYTITATLYVIEDEANAVELPDEVILLEGDVLESLKLALEGGAGGEITAYLSHEELIAHSTELKQIAQDAGYTLTLSEHVPRYLRFYPVYQRADGSLYADEFSTNFGETLDGAGFSSSGSYTQTVNGETRKESVSVSVSIRVVRPLETVRVVEMSAENAPLRAAELPRSELEQMQDADGAYTAKEDCAYVIVEEEYEGGGFGRTIYDRPTDGADAWHALNYPRADLLTEGVTLTIRFR